MIMLLSVFKKQTPLMKFPTQSNPPPSRPPKTLNISHLNLPPLDWNSLQPYCLATDNCFPTLRIRTFFPKGGTKKRLCLGDSPFLHPHGNSSVGSSACVLSITRLCEISVYRKKINFLTHNNFQYLAGLGKTVTQKQTFNQQLHLLIVVLYFYLLFSTHITV